MKLLDEARQKYGVRNVWTFDGRVMYKENNNISVYKKISGIKELWKKVRLIS